jgi:hypothetical protein
VVEAPDSVRTLGDDFGVELVAYKRRIGPDGVTQARFRAWKEALRDS